MAIDQDISLAALTVLELPPPEMVAVAARCGYSHIGLRAIAATPTEVHFPILTDHALRRETRAMMRDTGVGVLDIEILRLKAETVISDFEPALALGAEFGARFALIAGNDPDLARTADNFARLCELAYRFGIRPHLEFMPWTDVPDILTALQIVGETPNGGLLVDAFHLNRSGGEIAQIPANDVRFGYLQLCDIAGPVPVNMDDILSEARAARLFPGDGDCPLPALIDRVPAGVPISLEIPYDGLRKQGLSAEDVARRAMLATRRILDAL
jgi:sugar phosphate isomerase/epimerase